VLARTTCIRPYFLEKKGTQGLKYFTVVYVFILVTSNPRLESPSSAYVNITDY